MVVLSCCGCLGYFVLLWLLPCLGVVVSSWCGCFVLVWLSCLSVVALSSDCLLVVLSCPSLSCGYLVDVLSCGFLGDVLSLSLSCLVVILSCRVVKGKYCLVLVSFPECCL